jgi:hypothetical protein
MIECLPEAGFGRSIDLRYTATVGPSKKLSSFSPYQRERDKECGVKEDEEWGFSKLVSLFTFNS